VNDHEAIRQQIDRIIRCSELHNSEVLCKLLGYLAHHHVEHPGVSVKEYQIADEVFGRSSEYDPQVDSTVRVQVGRLRSKLAAYYAAEGASDPLVVHIPKGAYMLEVVPRSELPPGAAEVAAPSQRPRVMAAVFALLFVCCLVWALVLLRRPPQVAASANAPESLRIFWGAFASGSQPPWVIFSNGAFVGRPETGMRYYDKTKDIGLAVHDYYTGTGEVLAVHHLDGVFSQLHSQLRVKRASLFTLDDLSQNDLIFLGSPSENPTLSEIHATRHFLFQRVPGGARAGDLSIVNLEPQAGEMKIALASPSGDQTSEDYALVGLEQGSESGHRLLILAGTTTLGTQAAAEFVCRPDQIQELLKRLKVNRAEEMKPFEALLHVSIARGVPVETTIVAVRSDQ
jgi:hypothetical protein